MHGLRRGPSGPALSGTLRDQTLVWNTNAQDWIPASVASVLPGAPLYDITKPPFNAGQPGVSDTQALAAVIQAANAAPGTIYLSSRLRFDQALPVIANNNISVVGRGMFNGGTIVTCDSPTPIDAFVALDCQYTIFKDFWLTGARLHTTGSGLRFQGTYRASAFNVMVTSMGGGVEVDRCTLTELQRVNLGDLYGAFAHYAHGAAPFHNHAVKYRDCVCGTNFPLGLVGSAAPWAPLTAYLVGQVVVNGGNIYQCSNAGNSAAAGGPLGLPGSSPSNVHTAVITDGSCGWRFAMPAAAWYRQGSWSHTFEVLDCGALQGAYGLSVEDDVPASGSAPLFARTHNFQADHCVLRGMRFLGGAAHRNSMTFVTSVFGGSGVEIAGVSGWEFEGGEIFGCADAGVIVSSGNGILHGLQIDAVSGRTAGTRDCIEVGNSAGNFRVNSCALGNQTGGVSGSRYGLSIAAGSDRYAVTGNLAPGNTTGGFLNTPGVAATRVLSANVGTVT